MKKCTVGKAVVAVFLFFGMTLCSVRAFALADTYNNNSSTTTASATNNGNGNGNGNGNLKNVGNSQSNSNASIKNSGNSSSSSKVQNSGNSSIKNSGNSTNNIRTSTNQAQGQGQLQGQQQSNSGTNTTNDSSGSNNKAYAVAYPSVSGVVGNSTGNAGSIFGNLTISNTEKYKQIQEIIQTVNAEMAAGALDKATGQVIVDALNTKLLGTVKTQRVLGLLWETSGKNLSNLMGFLTWDSFWKDGKPQGGQLDAVTIALDTTETNKDVTGTTAPAATTGNGGNLAAGEQK